MASLIFQLRNIKAEGPMTFNITRGTTWTYLDTIGRPTLFLTKNNVVDEHMATIDVSFELPPFYLYLKPFAVACTFVLIYIAGFVFLNVDCRNPFIFPSVDYEGPCQGKEEKDCQVHVYLVRHHGNGKECLQETVFCL